MSDSEFKTTPGEPSGLDPVTVFFALGSEVRLPIVKLLADGRAEGHAHQAAGWEDGLDARPHLFPLPQKRTSLKQLSGLAQATPAKSAKPTP